MYKFTTLAIALSLSTAVFGQNDTKSLPPPTKLPYAAEFEGALLKDISEVYLHANLRVRIATLAADYERDGVVYRSGSKIYFHADKTVKSGTVKSDTDIQGVNVMEGTRVYYHENGRLKRAFVKRTEMPTSFNLNLPYNLEITWNNKGYITSIIYNSGVTDHQILERTCIFQLFVEKLKGKDEYALTKCTAGRPMIVGMQMVQKGNPQQGSQDRYLPVIVDKNANGTLYYNMSAYNTFPDYKGVETWQSTNFRFNGYNFKSALIKIKDMRLEFVQILEPTELDGITYPARSVLKIDENGKVYQDK